MAHLREQFLTRLSGTTLASLTTTGTRVEVARTAPLAQDASATLLIDLGAEQIRPAEILRGRARIVERELEVIIRGAVKAVAPSAGSSYLTALNAIALEVETAIGNDQSLGSLCKSVQLTAIDEPELEGAGEKTVAVVTLHFNILYLTALNAPQTPR